MFDSQSLSSFMLVIYRLFMPLIIVLIHLVRALRTNLWKSFDWMLFDIVLVIFWIPNFALSIVFQNGRFLIKTIGWIDCFLKRLRKFVFFEVGVCFFLLFRWNVFLDDSTFTFRDDGKLSSFFYKNFLLSSFMSKRELSPSFSVSSSMSESISS